MELSEVLKLVLLVAAGGAAGFINTLAGGGSLLTIPALIFLGIPSPVANGTNRLAILLQNVVSSTQFYRQRQLELREAALAAIPAVFGAVVGALVAANLSQEVFDTVLGAVLLLMLVTLFIRKPAAKGETREKGDAGAEEPRKAALWLRVPVFFVIGVYGGFIQAGVGFLLISGITLLLGRDLIKTNAIKVTIILLFSVISLLIFSLYGKVLWLYGLLLGVGTMAGAWVGVRFAVRRGANAVRWVVVVAVAASALRLFDVL